MQSSGQDPANNLNTEIPLRQNMNTTNLPNSKKMEEEEQGIAQSSANDYIKLLEKMDPSLTGMVQISEDNKENEKKELTFEEKILSKIWKQNLEAVKELKVKVEKEEIGVEDLKEKYLGFLVKCCSKTIPAIQGESLDLLSSFLGKFGERLEILKTEIFLKNFIEKIFSSSKPAIIKKSAGLLKEVVKSSKLEEIETGIKKLFETKNAKHQATIIRFLITILSLVGNRRFNILNFTGFIEKLHNSRNIFVKKETMNFYTTTMLWYGEGVKSRFSWLSKTQIIDLEKNYSKKKLENKEMKPEIEDMDSGGAMQLEIIPITVSVGLGNKEWGEKTPKKILTKYNESWGDDVLSQLKWKLKISKLEQLLNSLSIPRVDQKGVFSILPTLKKLLKDKNINVQLTSVKIIGKLGLGIRKDLGPKGKKFGLMIMDKLKDRKKKNSDIVLKALKECFYVSPPVNFFSEIKDVLLKSKNEVFLKNVLEYLKEYCKFCEDEELENFCRLYCGVAKGVAKNGSIVIRKMNSEILKFFEEKKSKFSNPGKLEEVLEECMVKNTNSGKKSSSTSRMVKSSNLSKSRTRKIKLIKKRPGNKLKRKKKRRDDEELLTYENFRSDLSLEEATAVIKNLNLYEKRVIEGLGASKWKEKVLNINELCEEIKSKGLKEEHSEALFSIIRHHTKSFKESNIRTISSVFDLFENLAGEKKVKLSKKAIYLISWLVTLKSGLPKFKEKIKTVSFKLCDNYNPKFFFMSLAENFTSKKPSPKSIAELFTLMSELVEKYSGQTPKREIMALIKQNSSSTHPLVKKALFALLCKMYQTFGNKIRVFLANFDKKFKEKFEKQVENLKPIVSQNSTASSKLDVSSELNNLIEQLNDKKWMNRKSALEKAESVLKSSGYSIKPKGITEFVMVLKERLNDSIVQVKNQALCFLKNFIKSIGNEYRSFSRSVTPLAVDFLVSKNDEIKKEAKGVLEMIAKEVSVENMTIALVRKLGSPNIELKLEILDFLVENTKGFARIPTSKYSKLLLNCLSHKSKSLRKKSENVIRLIIKHSDFKIWEKSTRKYPKTIQDNLMQNLQQFLPQGKMVEERSERKLKRTSNMVSPSRSFVEVRENQNSELKKILKKGLRNKIQPNRKISNFQCLNSSKTTPVTEKSKQKPIQEISIIEEISLIEEDTPKNPQFNTTNFDYINPQESSYLEIQNYLRKNFGEILLEKFKSDNKHHLNDSLVSYLSICTSNPERYINLLNLMYHFVYYRIFKTDNITIIQLFSKFIIFSLNQHKKYKYENLNVSVEESHPVLLRCISLIKAKLSGISKDAEGFFEKVVVFVAECFVYKSLFLYCLENLHKPVIYLSLVFPMLEKIVEKNDVKLIFSLKIKENLKNYVRKIKNLNVAEDPISGFFCAMYEKYGDRATEILDLKEENCVIEFLNSRFPSADDFIMTEDVFERLCNQIQTEEIITVENSIDEFTRVLQNYDSDLTALRTMASTISESICVMLMNIFKNFDFLFKNEFFLKKIEMFLAGFLGLKPVLQCVNEQSLLLLLKTIAALIIKSNKNEKIEEDPKKKKFFKRLKNRFTGLMVESLSNSNQQILTCTLIESIRESQGLMLKEPDNDSHKTTITISRNCIQQILEKLNNEKDFEKINLERVLARIHGYLIEFKECDEKVYDGIAFMKILVTKVSKILNGKISKFLTEIENREDFKKGRLWKWIMEVEDCNNEAKVNQLLDFLKVSEMKEYEKILRTEYLNLTGDQKMIFWRDLAKLDDEKIEAITELMPSIEGRMEEESINN